MSNAEMVYPLLFFVFCKGTTSLNRHLKIAVLVYLMTIETELKSSRIKALAISTPDILFKK